MATIEDLPVYRGMPVPYVARWSDEEHHELLAPRLVPDEHWQWPLMEYVSGADRDEFGVLWQRDGHSRSGEPQFGQVHTRRQVNCMRSRRCQVCGSKIDTEETLFLVGQVESMAPVMNGKLVTTTPPVCELCAAQAVQWCPDLKRRHSLIKARSYRPIAAWGPLYKIDSSTMNEKESTVSVKMVGLHDVPLGGPAIRAVIGKQLTIEIEVVP